MNYPVWYLPQLGGGLLIAIIAILHVVIAHLAVGGGLFLVLTERKAVKTKNSALLEYVRKHTWFFLLLTMVFGGMSGVGIWFIISLVNPAATSSLIHTFVFGWAIEWVFFIGEIVALLIYHYRFGKMDSKSHMILGWLYFIFAWLSLVVINGILGFMLTPGKWIETGSFWHGFFNPSYLPSLLFRTSISLIFAGVFGLVTGARLKNKEMRRTVFRLCARWMYIPLLVLVLTGIYYTRVIPAESFENLFHFNRESTPFITLIIVSSILLFGLGLFTLVNSSQATQKAGALVLVVICFGWMSGFEYMREIARKPFVLYGHMYSTGITLSQMDSVNSEGFLKLAKWTGVKELNEENLLEAGAEIFRLQCMACHTLDGYNGILNKSDRLTERGLEALLTGMGKVNSYMPPFAGTGPEKKALAAYIYRELQGKTTQKEVASEAPDLPLEILPFDPDTSDYVLLVWNDLGMHCISDNEKYFSFLPPANTLNAQLFKRGPLPELVKTGVTIEYAVEEGYEHPEYHSMFWEYDEAIFGTDLPEGTGLMGKGVNGTMELQGAVYAAQLIPVLPYRDDKTYNPYPLFTIRAFSESTGEMLAYTKVVAPTSNEMGCRNCHEGLWAWNEVSGMADLTAINILEVHDRYNGTTLLADAEQGKPRLCQSCHADPAVMAPGRPGVLNFSTAMHGFHANYLSGMDQEACNLCHPSHPEGNTNCFRGRHSDVGVTCTICHGTLEDHALSLLAAQPDMEASERLARQLEPVFVRSREEIKPRMPWVMEPDCRSCHTNFNIFGDGFDGTAFNRWVPAFEALYRNRTDNHGVMCSACHGSTHAVYGAYNKYGLHRDNQQPLQYQGLAGTIGTHGQCMVCHTVEMEFNGHHRNMVNRELPAMLVE
ncbi:MAG: cytochrome ubiquinol oxidase subunit I [Bacteroidales bacterium]|nr:cytochrome ubiquinol oxidase subunit I [Bacteroidales bacterium]